MAERSGYRFLVLPPALVLAAFWMTTGWPWTLWREIGVALMLCGLVLWAIAHIQLGDSFSVTPQARRLVTSGLYSRFRSPIYLFGGIGIAGFLLVIEQRIILLVFVALLIPLQIFRTRREGGVLEEKFGEEYREYARHTWF